MKKHINTKRKGARWERKVRKMLEQEGWFVVRQAASAFPDLVAISPQKDIYFIECKNHNYLSSKEKEALLELAQKYHAKPIYAYKNGTTESFFIIRTDGRLRGVLLV